MNDCIEKIEEEVEEMEELQKDNKEICHYTSIEALESIANAFKKSEDQSFLVLKATSAWETNDREELIIGFDWLMDFLKKLEKENNLGDSKYLLSNYYDDIKASPVYCHYSEERIINLLLGQETTPYVISFSRKKDNHDMWLKPYGRNGFGLCLVFDRSEFYKIQRPNGMSVHGPIDVVYDGRHGHLETKIKLMQIVFIEFMHFIDKVRILKDPNDIIKCKLESLDQISSSICSFIKGNGWHNESEVRLAAIRNFIPETDLAQIGINENGRHYVDIQLPISSLLRIIIGPCVCKENIQKVVKSSQKLGLSINQVCKSAVPIK